MIKDRGNEGKYKLGFQSWPNWAQMVVFDEADLLLDYGSQSNDVQAWIGIDRKSVV